MACVVRYGILLISIYLRSTSWAVVQVTPLIGTAGNNIIIQCATDKTPQDGVYMYKHEESENKQLILYYYKDGTITPKEKYKYRKFHVDGKIPNLNVTFSNVNTTDTGLYWCEFNYEEKTTVGTVTWLWIVHSQKKQEEEDKKVCPDVPHAKNLSILYVVILLLSIICLGFVILKVRECWKNRPSNSL